MRRILMTSPPPQLSGSVLEKSLSTDLFEVKGVSD
jgi:hypothetical protein